MALDIHGLNVLRLASASGADLSSVLTFGRLGLWLGEEELGNFFREAGLQWSLAEVKADGYCEAFLRRAFGTAEVASLDGSPYEGATLIHDMNVPLGSSRQFSTVLDFGALEHVFNLPVALSNLITACRDGGHLLHVLPTNNWCGHGFYQFSPELFFSVYSDKRGFRGTQVFLVEWNRPSRWYRVRSPLQSGKRVNVVNREKTLVLVMTQKTAHAQLPMHSPPQQSDYVLHWTEKPEQPAGEGSHGRLRRFSRSYGLSSLAAAIRQPLRSLRAYLFGHKDRLRRHRPDLESLDVAALVGRRTV